ncbi:MAG: VF530 family DNA-binding protein, partial [Burkholderiaceae bacterium]
MTSPLLAVPVDWQEVQSLNRLALILRLLDTVKSTRMTQPQPRNPLHGITLEQLLVDLVERVGWEATPHVWRMLAPKSRRSSSTSS